MRRVIPRAVIIGYYAVLSCLLLLQPAAVHGLKPAQYGNGPNMSPPSTSRGAYDNGNNNNGGSLEEYDEAGGYAPNTSFETESAFDQQSVEERLASWRAQQQQRFESQNPVDEQNPRDEDGRLKLLASVSRGSISVFFFILMWRSVHHFELADQALKKSSKRPLLVVPAAVLFVVNMAGCLASVTSRTAGAKKRMKAVLNLNKLVEICLFLYNMVRLAIFTNKFVPREVYISKVITNVMFLVQCQLFTRVTWDAAKANQNMNPSPEYNPLQRQQPTRQRSSNGAADNNTQGDYPRSGYDNDNDYNDDGDLGYSQRQPPSYIESKDDWQR